MMTLEQTIASVLGELQFQLIVKTHQLEAAQRRIAELEAEKKPEKKPEKKNG